MNEIVKGKAFRKRTASIVIKTNFATAVEEYTCGCWWFLFR